MDLPKRFHAYLRHAFYHEALLRTTDNLVLEGDDILPATLSGFDLELNNIQPFRHG